MTADQEARTALIKLLSREHWRGRYYYVQTQSLGDSRFFELGSPGTGWSLRLRPNLVAWIQSPTRNDQRVLDLLRTFGVEVREPMSDGDYMAEILGPLGLAALRAHIASTTTTVVGETTP